MVATSLLAGPDAGTTVRLRFPLATRLDAPAELLVRPRRSQRILLVEDNQDGREFMKELLATDGHVVDCVSMAGDALALLTRTPDAPEYDLLLTDIGLPDGNGWDLVAEARSRWRMRRIGVGTGWEGRTSAAGADFVLRKPVRTSELLDHVAADA